jgi:hypothetical protein
MGTMPWRILVVTDAGVDSGRPVAVEGASLDAWMASLNLQVALPGGKTLAASSLAALAPGAIAEALGAGAATSAIDAALHESRLQRVESAWRGLALLLSHVAEPVRVEVVSLARKTLVERFRAAVYEPELEAAEPLSLVVLDMDFTHRAEDLAALAQLAGMCADLQSPIVANAPAAFFELRFLVQAAAMQELAERLAGPAHANWTAFQRTDEARWVTLTLNRFLLREPWQTEAHQERCSESEPDTYLWGRGVWLVAAAIARSVAAHGHALDLSGAGGQFAPMPTRAYPAKANESVALTTEIPFAEMQMLTLAHAAFAPLVGPLQADRVILPLVTTVHRFTPSKLTLEGTLAYQLTAARVAQVCGDVVGRLGGGVSPEALSAGLREGLGGMLTDAPEGLKVEVTEAAGDAPRTVAVTVSPAVTLEGKNPEFALEFALG